MATYAAVSATSAAILGLLEAAAAAEAPFATASFRLLTSSDLQGSSADQLAVSLYLYHVGVNTSRRAAPGRMDPSGVRRLPALPLDLHYLMTAWAKDAGTQQRLFGWAARVIQDTPTLPASLLNAYTPDEVFRPDESVEIVWESLSQQDVFDIWEVARAKQQPSAAYVARIVEIESLVVIEEFPPVQTTDIRYGTVPA
jgi:hypothetical protein